MNEQHPKQTHEKLPHDEFGRGESWHWIVLGVPAAIATIALLFQWFGPRNGSPMPGVVVYCAQDMVYAEPILRGFEQQNNCRVRTVFDSEAVKTVGLANRLLAERARPRCDLFWGNEEMRTRQLAKGGIFRAEKGWVAFGYRSRRLVVNTNLIPLQEAPTSLMELTNSEWRGKLVIAYPHFGTTATHFHALRQLWGNETWAQWCQGLASNEPFMVEGNSSVVKLVASGAAPVGFTDSDDVLVGQRKGWPIEAEPMNAETLLIPNTIGVVNKPEVSPLTEKLFQYLQSPEVVQKLVAAGALEGSRPGETDVKTLQIDWEALLRDLDQTTAELKRIFLR